MVLDLSNSIRMPGIVKSLKVRAHRRSPISIPKSLTLLNVYALKADLRVPTRVAQKLIRRKEVRPISSQPINSSAKFPANTRRTILITKELINRIKRSTFGSYLKYENA